MTTQVKSPMIKEGNDIPVTATGSTTARALEDRFADVVNVRDFYLDSDNGDWTRAIQAALDIGGSVYVPDGIYLVTDTLHIHLHGTRFFGNSKNAIIEAQGMEDKPVILTFDGVTDIRTNNVHIENICVAGTAHTAFAWVNATLGGMRDCRVEDGSGGASRFVGEHGFLFERTWGCHHSNLSTAGASLTVPFAIYEVVLAQKFDSLYTSNYSEHCIYMDTTIKKYSVGTGTGAGVIEFNQPTLQGSSSYAMVIIGYDRVTVNTCYSENVGAHFYIDSQNTRSIVINNSEVTSFGAPGAGGEHSTWVGGSKYSPGTLHNITFSDCAFGEGKFVLDGVYSRCKILCPFAYSNRLIEDSIAYGVDCPTTMPLNITNATTGNGNTSYSITPPGFSGFYVLNKFSDESTFTREELAVLPSADTTPYQLYAGGL